MLTLVTGNDEQMWFQSLEEGQCILTKQSITISQSLMRINEAIEHLTRQHRVDETMVHRGDMSIELSSQTLSAAATKW
jgi:hypothetical protein